MIITREKTFKDAVGVGNEFREPKTFSFLLCHLGARLKRIPFCNLDVKSETLNRSLLHLKNMLYYARYICDFYERSRAQTISHVDISFEHIFGLFIQPGMQSSLALQEHSKRLRITAPECVLTPQELHSSEPFT